MAERNWTQEQQQAISQRASNLLVAAGAGSGKTAVLVERVVSFLIQAENPLDIDQMLVVTFTNAAAAEMRQRIGEALEDQLAQDKDNAHLKKQLALLPRASICTLHAFCLDLIRQFFYKLDLDPGLRVANQMEISMLEEDAMEAMLSRRYDRGDGDLQLLLSCFGNGPWDDNLRQQLLRLSDFSRATPDPEAWLQRLPLAYLGQDTAWLDYLFSLVQKELENACQALEMAASLCDKPGGPQSYLPLIQQELAALRGVAQAQDWQQTAWQLAALEFCPRLPSIRKTDGVEDSLKTMAQASRNTAKTIVKGLKENYFATPLEEEQHKLQQMQPVAQALVNLTLDYQQELKALKRAKRLIDFQDMEHDCLALLEEPSGEVRAALQKQYRAVFVDEYQDINQVQDKVISLIADGNNLFMVGDVKQSIYRFRLAEPGLFQQKFHDYGQARGGRRIDLQRNFRSAPVVLADVNAVFSQLMTAAGAEIEYDDHAALIPGLPADIAGVVSLHLLTLPQEVAEEDISEEEPEDTEELLDAQTEARHIGREILKLHNQGYQYRDMVILLRSLKTEAPIFRQELAAMGIPCHGSGEQTFYQAAEISTMISLLQVIDNPRQDIHLAAVLHSPIAGLSLEELAELRLAAKGDLYDALLASEQPKAVSFRQQLEHWRKPGRSNRISLLLNEIYQETGFYQLAGALPGGSQRQANLLFLLNQAKEYEDTSYRGLYRFLTFIKRYMDSGQGAEHARTLGENENVVRIVSIHHSKGLEYPVVFIGRLSKNFNTRDCYQDMLLHKQLGLALPYIDLKKKIKYKSLFHQAVADKIYWETIAEEMRLLYVAMTRAKERLYLVGSCHNLERLLKNTAITCQVPQKSLPPYLLDRGVNYLTWLVRALWRHPDGEPLRVNWFGAARPELVRQDIGGAFSLELDASGAIATAAATQVPDWLEPVAQGRRLFQQRHAGLDALMAWRYPNEAATRGPVKWTITGLQQQQHLARENQQSVIPTTYVSEQDALSRGVTVHYLLEHLDFNACQPRAALAGLLQECVSKGLCSEELAASLDLDVVLDFLASPLGQRCRGAKQLLREQPFTFLCPSESLEIGLPPGEQILLQGTIDLAFLERDRWVLVDYKYANPKGLDQAAILEKYGAQLTYYRQALQRILGEPCGEGYLYFLPARQQVQVF